MRSSSKTLVGGVAVLFLGSVLLGDLRVFTVALVLALRWASQPIVSAYLEAHSPTPECERYFETKSDFKRKALFPSVFDPPQEGEDEIDLSVIVPAYREEQRLGKMLDETVEYLEARRRQLGGKFAWEIIVVDDGSPDGTFKLALEYTDRFSSDRVRVLKLERNGGKGGAVRKGMLRSRGKMVLMADADGATKFSEVEKLERALGKLKGGDGFAAGSRAHLVQANARASGLRGFVSRAFQTLFVTMLVPGGIRDTQCGFKLFTKGAVQKIFPLQRMNGWAFDCELLFLARKRFDLPVLEVAVDWTDVDGSTLSVADASLEMARDICVMSFMFAVGLW
ncbi:hypothetical protein BASA81_010376 [Batrachochytrium salamandrivorans]|nr:hypothetical protein BASA81_010376 [Batrachochytrium salamandrivorans]